MSKAFQRYRALDAESRALFHRSALLLPWIAISLRFRGFKKTQAALQKHVSVPTSQQLKNPSASEAVQRTCRMVKAAGHYGVTRPTCLADSLTLWYLLQKQNLPANLRIGVRKVADRFEAHAWVEYDDQALNQLDEHHQHYAAFDTAFTDVPIGKP